MKKFIAGMLIGAVISGGSAYAGRLITSKDIKNRSLQMVDFSDGTVADTVLASVFSGSGSPGTAEEPMWTSPNGGLTAGDRIVASSLSPTVDLAAGDFFVTWIPDNETGASLRPDESVRITLYVDANPTSVACTVTGSSLTCSTNAQATIPAKSRMTMKMEHLGSSPRTGGRLQWSLTTSTL